jgi:hypothetical protein
MALTFSAVYQRDGDGWIGWMEELSEADMPGRTLE